MINDNDQIFEAYVQEEGVKDMLAAGALGLGSLMGPQAEVQAKEPTPIVQQSKNFTKDLADQLTHGEGIRTKKYLDSKGIPTVGIGYNLTNPTARQDLAAVGADLKKVNAGIPLTMDQVYNLFDISRDRAIKDARQYIPDFDKLPYPAQLVVADMSFNLGLSKLGGFVDFKKALEERDFNKAADEMVDSKWYKDVKTRGPRLVLVMKSAAEEVAEPGTRDADEKIIIVKQGDTLTKISRDQKIDLNELIKANPGINPDKIQIGQKLKLP